MNNLINNNKVVLVVDDSPDTLSFLNDTLEQAGYSVLVALEGAQALRILKRFLPNMILLDALMPNMDGFETCRRIKADPQLERIPVIFMTGLSETKDIVKGLELGGVDYLTKPVSPDELLARMRTHITHAEQTNSAYDALDTAGQYLFTANTNGNTVWATPRTYAFLAGARLGPEGLSQSLRGWLASKPVPGSSLKLNGSDNPLSVVIVDRIGEDEVLLKLVDEVKPDAEQTLKTKLGLTRRESEVLFWISNGKTNREIATILDMSPRTVNKHLEQIFPKLGVVNRTAAARIALRVLA
jgi:DNA-binding NarL/FixJ family response regulator